MNIELDVREIEAHFEITRQILAFIKTQIPQTKDDVHGRQHSLTSLYIDEDAILTAIYSRYRCGETTTMTEYPKLSDLV